MIRPSKALDLSRTATKRLCSIDVLRGFALLVVLVDHIDYVALDAAFVFDWSLNGYGFCDFAEVFVYLSGFTFGWVYGTYLERMGPKCFACKVARRWLQLVLGYLSTSTVICAISCFAEHQSIHRVDTLSGVIIGMFWLGFQPFTLMIICLYISLLPILAIALFSFLCFPKTTIAASAALYTAVQFYPRLNLYHSEGSWFFNPFAWQFFAILAMAIGYLYRRRSNTESSVVPVATSTWGGERETIWPNDEPRSKSRLFASTILLCGAITVLGLGLFVEKGDLMLGNEKHATALSAIHFSQNETVLVNKTRIAPLRIFYFFSLTYVVSFMLPRDDAYVSQYFLGPILACGRNSLSVYCVGVVLTHLASVTFDLIEASPEVIILTALNACVIQFVFAILIEHFRLRYKAIVVTCRTTLN